MALPAGAGNFDPQHLVCETRIPLRVVEKREIDFMLAFLHVRYRRQHPPPAEVSRRDARVRECQADRRDVAAQRACHRPEEKTGDEGEVISKIKYYRTLELSAVVVIFVLSIADVILALIKH
jgi:hypothetical protein